MFSSNPNSPEFPAGGPRSNSSESPRRVTIRDIANILGLSRASVSLGLRNSNQMSEATCRRIQETARQIGYEPNLSAANLAHFRHRASERTITAAIAWINCWRVPEELRGYRQFEKYWQSASQTAGAAGFRLEEFIVDPSFSVARLQKIFITRNIYGIIIPPHGLTSHWKKMSEGTFDWNRFSAVRIGTSISSPEVAVVTPDQVGNSMLAFRKMTELGYRRVGYVTTSDIRKLAQNWFLGGYFLGQIALPATQQVPVLYLETDAMDPKALGNWIRRHKPDAILTELVAVRKMLTDLGFNIPADIGLASLNTLDSDVDAGIYQNPELIGKGAAEVLIALITRNERGGSSNCRTTNVMGRWQDGSTLPPVTAPASSYPIH